MPSEVRPTSVDAHPITKRAASSPTDRDSTWRGYPTTLVVVSGDRMLGTAKEIYLATRKKNDLLFNVYVMRPIAAFVVGVVAKTPLTPNQLTLVSLFLFFGAAVAFIGLPSYLGGILG